jgi:hypothetical protein
VKNNHLELQTNAQIYWISPSPSHFSPDSLSVCLGFKSPVDHMVRSFLGLWISDAEIKVILWLMISLSWCPDLGRAYGQVFFYRSVELYCPYFPGMSPLTRWQISPVPGSQLMWFVLNTHIYIFRFLSDMFSIYTVSNVKILHKIYIPAFHMWFNQSEKLVVYCGIITSWFCGSECHG